MKGILCLMTALLLVFATVSFAEKAEADTPEKILSEMTLRDKVAQMMIASFRVWQEVPAEGEAEPETEPPKVNITELNEPIREMLGRNHFGGILLFGENFVDPEQTIRLVSDLKTTNRAGGGLSQIFFIDQEGGNVNRIGFSTQGVSNMALGASGETENAKTMAAIHGEEIRLLGIHANFAPVMDVNNNPSNPVIGIRSFSDDPQTVAAFGCAYLEGLHEQGVMAALKHFPGHGNTDTDSHTGFPLINSSYEELKTFELIPFKAAINAGADLLILPGVRDTNKFKLTDTYVDTAVALVEKGEIDEARVNESVLRILKLKQKYGILDLTDFDATEERIAAAAEGVGSAAHRETERQIAEKAVTLVKNEQNAFPLKVQAGEKTLILFADSCASRAGTGDLARKLLEEKQALPEGAEITVMKNTKDNGEDCIQAAAEADHVILVHRVYSQACMDPATEDGFSSGTFDQVIDAVHQKGKTVIVVSCQLPYDAARFPEADAILLTYWGSVMRELPAESSSWSANLPAGLLACFDAGDAGGRLPVNIPGLDEQYQPTGEILWHRGEAADR